MGEIKSTLELAMERTKNLTISQKEKEEIKQKEVLHKATTLFHRYREGHLPLNEILKEIEKMDERTSTTVKESLLSQWIEALSLNDDDERILKGIESLKQKTIDEIKQSFHHILSQYQGEHRKVKEEVKVQFAEALRKEGLYGSAVDPHIEGSELWKKENEKLNLSFKTKLEEIKQQLRAL